MPHATTLEVMSLLDEIRATVGVVYLSGHDCLTAIVSTVLATCSKASHAASSSSATSFIFSTVSASYSPEKSLTSSIR